jgi:hypothetical protein
LKDQVTSVSSEDNEDIIFIVMCSWKVSGATLCPVDTSLKPSQTHLGAQRYKSSDSGIRYYRKNVIKQYSTYLGKILSVRLDAPTLKSPL